MKLNKALDKAKHIHYWDNGSWAIYDKTWVEIERVYDKTDEYPDPILEGADYDNRKGYAPDLVTELAKKLGITVDSI